MQPNRGISSTINRSPKAWAAFSSVSRLIRDSFINGIANYLALTDPAGFILNAPLLATPGVVFHYNNAATHKAAMTGPLCKTASASHKTIFPRFFDAKGHSVA